MTFFVSETLIFDTSVIVFNKNNYVNDFMTHMLPLMLHNEALKIHTSCIDTR